MSASQLSSLKSRLFGNTRDWLVVRNGRTVDQRYVSGHGPTVKQSVASTSKALVGGLATALALTDGKVSLDSLAASHVTAWRGHVEKSRITVRQLGSHASGLQDAIAGTAFGNDFWDQNAGLDAFTLSRDRASLLFSPGTGHQYSNPGFAMLSYVLTARVGNLRTLLKARLMDRLGIPTSEWSIGYGRTITVDGFPLVASWGGGSYSPRAAACLGRVLAQRGVWDGQAVLSSAAVDQVTTDVGTPNSGGIGWWSNADGHLGAGVPHNAYYSWGANDQIVFVSPDHQLIAVRYGSTLSGGPSDFRLRIGRAIAQPLMAAVSQ
jgi:CubicO group peptidase (beta-lactamase class C family)